MDPEAVHVGDNQQRRVIQRNCILLELGESLVEILALALVFPGEAALAPDINPALAARGLGRTFLEGEPFALGVGADRVFLAQQRAEVVEMGLRCGAFLQLGGPSLFDEFTWRQDPAPQSRARQ
jgi:hypothetical protein